MRKVNFCSLNIKDRINNSRKIHYPYPNDNGLYYRLAAITSMLVFLFVIVFKPLVLEKLNFTSLLIVSLLISVVVFLVIVLLYSLHYSKYLLNNKWTLYLEVEILVLKILLITFLINVSSKPILGFFLEFEYTLFFGIKVFLYVLVLVVVINVLIYRNYFLSQEVFKKENKDNLSIGRVNNEKIKILGKNKNESFELEIDSFVYAKSEGHYLKIYYKNSSDNIDNIMIRNTIKSLTDQLLDFDFMVQCHRSHLVNTKFIDRIYRKSEGRTKYLKLVFGDFDIPISRNMIEKFGDVDE